MGYAVELLVIQIAFEYQSNKRHSNSTEILVAERHYCQTSD